MIGANTLVNSAILKVETGDDTKFFKNNVSPVYQEGFIIDNIYTNLGDSIGFLILLPLLLLYLRITSSMLH
jgi:hypothetical protein